MKLVWTGFLGSLGVLVRGLVVTMLIKSEGGIGDRVCLGSAPAGRFGGLRVGILACVRLGNGLCTMRSLLVATGAGRAMVAAASRLMALDGGLQVWAFGGFLAAVALDVCGFGTAQRTAVLAL